MADLHLDQTPTPTFDASSAKNPLSDCGLPKAASTAQASASTGNTAQAAEGVTQPALRHSWPLRWSDAGLLVLGYLLLAPLFVALGKLVTGPLDGSLGELDRAVATSFERSRTSNLNDVSYWGSMLSETGVKIGLTAVAAIVMIAVWRRWDDAVFVAIALILEACVFLTVTLLVERARPDVVQLDSSPVDSSFPSGHVAAAVVYGAFVVIVSRHTQKRWPVAVAFSIAAAVSLAVAWARLYRGMHYLNDVVAGVMLGLSSVLVTWLVMRRAERRSQATP